MKIIVKKSNCSLWKEVKKGTVLDIQGDSQIDMILRMGWGIKQEKTDA